MKIANIIFFRLLNPVNINTHRLFTHKSVFSALAINPDYWPSNGSHSRDMQNDLKLMYNSYQGLSADEPNDYYGYPNLGQPNNHWDITPFEAIFLGNKVLPHINLKGNINDAGSVYREAVNDFIRNEVEPWYLFLQNDHLGAQARNDYTYTSFRRAKYSIVTGKSVTPKTDIGEYVVEANAALILHAGDFIKTDPGTHFKAGSSVHIKIQYNACVHNKIGPSTSHSNHQDMNSLYNNDTHQIYESKPTSKDAIVLYPNPSKDYFTVVSKQETPITSIHIYNLNGNLVLMKEHLYTARYRFQNSLARGTYIVNVNMKDGEIVHKKLVVL